MVFSGDLWLMRGPIYDRKMKGFSFYFRRSLFRIRRFLAGKGWQSVMVIEQDLAVKEALKRHFSLVRVKPGMVKSFWAVEFSHSVCRRTATFSASWVILKIPIILR